MFAYSKIQRIVAKRRKIRVFVSYSRHDEALVRPLAGLLGAAAPDAVFLDVTSLKPGDLWDKQIMNAVKEASVFVICWCCESDRSTFIAKEISAALAEGDKKLVPVLFCSTPLPPSLADRQWIDLRGQVTHVCPLPHVEEKKKQKKGSPREPAERKLNRIRIPRPDAAAAQFSGLLEGLGQPSDEDRGARSVSLPTAAASSSRPKGTVYALGAALLLCLLIAFSMVYLGSKAAKGLPTPDTMQAPTVRNYLPIVFTGLLVIAVAYVTFRLIRRFGVIQRRHDRQQAENIAAAAASYFKGLGKSG